MKHAEAHLKDMLFDLEVISEEEYRSSYIDEDKIKSSPEYAAFIKMIKQAQRDAYNQAIDDVNDLIENHRIEVHPEVIEDILKLKK